MQVLPISRLRSMHSIFQKRVAPTTRRVFLIAVTKV
ncbi:hypothetical protein BH11PSE8_BH11PSE8_19430 [soil metagenome]